MTRPARHDKPGGLYHVTNRAVGRRPMFESTRDARTFLARLACIVRRGMLRVVAYSVLQTHFHLLVQSVDGRLSEALAWLQGGYARRFNLPRDRDGALMKGRFYSRLVDDEDYLRTCVRYIDHNPCDAGLAERPELWAFGSVRAYLGGRQPPWLDTSLLEETVRRILRTARFDADGYRWVFGIAPSPQERSWVERRVRAGNPRTQEPRVGPLRGRPPQWLEARARLADGLPIDPVPVAPARIRETIAAAEAAYGRWALRASGRGGSRWRVSEIALLRQVGRLTQDEIAHHMGISRGSVRHALHLHEHLLRADPAYADRVKELAISCQAPNG